MSSGNYVVAQKYKIITAVQYLLLVGSLDDFARLAFRNPLGDDREGSDGVRVVEGVHGGLVYRTE